MSLPSLPSPCPELRPGLALGAPEHQGFVAFWNWLVGVFRRASENFVLDVNGIKGDVRIVGSEGISVSTSGQTITISLGEGDSTDKESPADTSGGGAGDLSDPGSTDEPHDIPSGDEPVVPPSSETVCKCGAFAWDPSARQIKSGGFFAKRRFYPVAASALGQGDGLYQLRIDMNNGSPSGSIVSGVELGAAPTDSACWIPLFRIADGVIADDYRGVTAVQMWE
jgi:hypothetical protein